VCKLDQIFESHINRSQLFVNHNLEPAAQAKKQAARDPKLVGKEMKRAFLPAVTCGRSARQSIFSEVIS
jgi:hypothetical protein